MTSPVSDQPTVDEHPWGTPQSAPESAWSAKKILAAVGIAGAVAVAGGGVIYAASNSSENNGGPGNSPFGAGPGMNMNSSEMTAPNTVGLSGTPLHGEFVVAGENGGYRTELVQTGTVTAVSDTAVTAKSSDDFTQTYTLADTSNIAVLKVVDTVSIQGTESDGAVTAVTITPATGSGAKVATPGPDVPMNGPQGRPGK
ncbi:hypothetical protein [Antrihabitans stalactiti]|uniref:DUF5666 domain-containing protein n=1 Tax=Antrihabitans stalactiti TaxID=2584121 RepID=A0A848KUM9_9NOCA|nr:hypothetical protein [Antrihabitans stalactiti]NMN99227.1 hypothetical protein [Antrihabitans stalactiti]